MNASEKLFLMYYFLTREDGQTSRLKRATFLLETVLTFMLSSLFFIILGLINFRVEIFIIGLGIVGCAALISYLVVQTFYIKSEKVYLIIGNINNYTKREKRFLSITALFSIFLSFALMFLGGILMSYLLSLNK